MLVQLSQGPGICDLPNYKIYTLFDSLIPLEIT